MRWRLFDVGFRSSTQPTSDRTSLRPTIIISNTPIWHDSVAQYNAFHASFTKALGSHKVDISEVDIIEEGFIKKSTTEVSPSEVSIIEYSLQQISPTQISANHDNFMQGNLTHADTTQISPTEIGSTKVNIIQNRISEFSSSKIGFAQFSPLQITPFQVGITQISSGKIEPHQTNISQVNSSQINPGKVSFPILKLTEKFFYTHNLAPTSINNIYKDNPLNLFDPTFNINLQITDLPTGQLAAAQITNYDSLGRPNGGTILIDHNANGIGWFIDPTPFDNTEFTTR